MWKVWWKWNKQNPSEDPLLLQAGSECMHHESVNSFNYGKTLESKTPHESRFWRNTRILRTKDASSNRGNSRNNFTQKPITKNLQALYRCRIWIPQGFVAFHEERCGFSSRKMQFPFKDKTKEINELTGRRKFADKWKSRKREGIEHKPTYLNLKESNQKHNKRLFFVCKN